MCLMKLIKRWNIRYFLAVFFFWRRLSWWNEKRSLILLLEDLCPITPITPREAVCCKKCRRKYVFKSKKLRALRKTVFPWKTGFIYLKTKSFIED